VRDSAVWFYHPF
jgi:hypothetical protein